MLYKVVDYMLYKMVVDYMLYKVVTICYIKWWLYVI